MIAEILKPGKRTVLPAILFIIGLIIPLFTQNNYAISVLVNRAFEKPVFSTP